MKKNKAYEEVYQKIKNFAIFTELIQLLNYVQCMTYKSKSAKYDIPLFRVLELFSEESNQNNKIEIQE